MARALLALALLGLCASAQAASVRLVDSKQNAYLGTASQAKLSKPALQGVVAALTGLLPAELIDQTTSEQIASLVKPSPLKKPKAHVCFSVAGLNQDDIAGMFGDRQFLPAELEEEAHVADAIAAMLDSFAAVNPEVTVVMLDDAAVQDCQDEACVQQFMTDAAAAIGLSQSSSGALVLGEGVELDHSQLSDKLFANELASLFAGVNSQVAQQAGPQAAPEDIQMLEMTMLGLQGLANSYGADATQLAAGKVAAKQMLQWAVDQLDVVFEGDVTFQIATFDAVPEQGAEAALGWKERSRSRRLAATTGVTAAATGAFPGPNEAVMAKLFSAKAAAYGGFILLLYFMLAGVYCLCNMPFKKDTLLWGSKKDQ